MIDIYKANKTEKKTLLIGNEVETQSIVYINGIEFDNVILSGGVGNQRVLELDLKDGDIVTVLDNELVKYEVK